MSLSLNVGNIGNLLAQLIQLLLRYHKLWKVNLYSCGRYIMQVLGINRRDHIILYTNHKILHIIQCTSSGTEDR